LCIFDLSFMNTGHAPLSIRKTRIAPTPSGYLHLGNILSFAITAVLADRHQASIVLRIDDLDRQRMQPAYIQDIFDTLDFLDLPWHEGPRSPQEFEREYSQLHRLNLYQEALRTLKDRGALFACDCSRTDILQADPTGAYTGRCRQRALPLNMAETSWRLRTAADVSLTVNTLEQPVAAFLPGEQQDFVIRKKDGFPAYQLASLVDDQYFGIDLIVRGTDLWPSTLAQNYLARVLSMDHFLNSTFHHHVLLTQPGGRKLSKSAGDTSIQHLRKEGRTPGDIYALIARSAGIQENVRSWKELGEWLL
jgi:glutamyl/glutaminyl-tRNA synthetase